ncbi:STAS domain-containing protein [Caldichromatium japonicum]|uniref:STAS domain-containing protein n=1 Tax=Caldichromatium japonicum TaxID=2699430 RepID=A0A6G7VE09_9GAMM|nr:STAS domain-containing protein [Caldichromatium japonicum]QIK38279.1 STAS domain-containing protein [Caldichromatium japonicum]
MGVTSRIDTDQRSLIIAVEGRFDFSQHRDFRNAYQNVAPGSLRFIVDLSRATYLDSSALGMLLLLREHVGGRPDNICITGTNEDVRRVLKIANFDKLFTID